MSVEILGVNTDAIPAELKAIPQWVAWRGEETTKTDGTLKLNKIPINPKSGKLASSTDPKTWGSFDQAVRMYERKKLGGIGFVLTRECGIIGGDIDGCRSAAGVDEKALGFLKRLNTYTEVSPSQTGVRFFAKGKLPAFGRKKDRFEMYDSERFMTVTGVEIPGVGGDRRKIEDRTAEILEIHALVFGAPGLHSKPNGNGAHSGNGHKRSSDELTRVFQALLDENPQIQSTWEHKRPDFKDDQSRYDQSLANVLVAAGWNDDEIRFLIGAHRKEHGRDTDKVWKRKDYIEKTIAKARESLGIKTANGTSNGAAKPDWTQLLRWTKTKYGEFLTKDLANVRDLVLAHPGWQGAVGFEEFNGRVVAVRCPPSHVGLPKDSFPRPWTDADDACFAAWLQKLDPPLSVGLDLASVGLAAAARHNLFHPVREYLDGIRWDGKYRLDTWLEVYLGAESGGDEYLRAVGSKWMISAVARVREPGSKVDTLLILEGPQGTKKSTALRVLGGRWFTDEIDSLHSKDAPLQLQGAWIVELAELDALQRNEISRVKAFLAKSFDRFRAPYGHHVEMHLRQCVFAGTVNSRNYFRDETGARRFWPVRCGTINVDALAQDRDQLWAEAGVRYSSGERWWLEGAVTMEAIEQQEARYQADEWEGLIEKFVETREIVSIGQILADVLFLKKSEWGQAEQNRAVRCLSRIGWERRQIRVTKDDRMLTGIDFGKGDRAWVYAKIGGRKD